MLDPGMKAMLSPMLSPMLRNMNAEQLAGIVAKIREIGTAFDKIESEHADGIA